MVLLVTHSQAREDDLLGIEGVANEGYRLADSLSFRKSDQDDAG